MVKLFIEGSTDRTNGNLREGFAKLFGQKLKDQMPRLVMGNGKDQTIDKFMNDNSDEKFLLIDLDKNENQRTSEITALGLSKYQRSSFFMIQEMEAWILSQPNVLDAYYKGGISKQIPSKHSKEISDPSDELVKLTKRTRKGEYHKIKDAVNLLPLLDLSQLEIDFEDVKKLIQTLTNISTASNFGI